MSGFFGTEADLWVDLFLLVLVLLLPTLLFAVGLARRGRIRAHATVMVTAFVVFVVVLVAFEIDVRTSDVPAPATVPFLIHLCFALPGLALWIYQVSTARRAFANPAPHRRRGRILFGLLVTTVATGIWLYLATYS